MKNKDPKKETPFNKTKPNHFYDKSTGSAYYFIRVDDFVSLVVIFLEKHTSPDNTTSESVMDLANKLSGVEVLASLNS